jgi:hypothetical protein
MSRATVIIGSLILFATVGTSAAQDEIDALVPQGLEVAALHETITVKPPTRPLALVPLYAGFAGLEASDGYLTWVIVHHGGNEQNALAAPWTSNPYAWTGFKAATTIAMLFGVDQLRRQHPKAAIITMIAMDVAMGLVVWHNNQQTPVTR